MRVLVFGETGQVATELRRAAAARGIGLESLSRAAADLADPAACAGAVRATSADAVINAAAYTAVDRAESEPELAHAVNADGPGAIARACAARALPVLHISTDYVFDGSPGRPWREDDAPAPLSAYGRSKRAGEVAVEEAATRDGNHAFAILRTGWVFSAHGSNFVKTMLRVGAERDALRIVDDQVGGPTPARAIADALLTMAEAFAAGRGVPGYFHFGGTPPVSWAEFAEAIFAMRAQSRDPRSRDFRPPAIERIPSSDYPVPAERPRNSVLDCARIRDAYGIEMPDWRSGLARVLEELP